MAVVDVLTSGKTKDSILALCARNFWLLAAIYNISIHIVYILGKNNVVANILSRFKFDTAAWQSLQKYVPNFIWIHTHIDQAKLNHAL